MSKLTRTLLAAVFGAVAMSVTVGASAHDNDGWGPPGHAWGHYRHWHKHHHHEMIRERIIIRQPPPVVYEQPVYYGAPYYYRRAPAIVIGVDVPPLVIPLR